MKWLNDNGTADMTGVAVSGQLPTLSAGIYHGIFVSSYLDAENKQWITLASNRHGSHIEQSDMDVTHLEAGTKILFTIESQQGAGLIIKGRKYKLVGPDRTTELTGWTDLAEIYKKIRDEDIVLAGPFIKEIKVVE